MYCPSCGKAIPDGSKYCLHCGSSVGAPTTTPKTEWEYKDFFRQWDRGTGGTYDLDAQHTETTNRLRAWNDTQSFLLPLIQEWLDDGWKPLTEIGPAAFTFRAKTGIFDILFIRASFEVSEFRVKMRRAKRA